MATTDIWPIPCAAVVPTSSYTSGGTALGEKLSVAAVSIEEDLDILTRQPSGSFWADARLMGCNLMISVVLAESSAAVLAVLHPGRIPSASNVKSRNSIVLGKRLGSADYTKFLLRPTDSTKPYLYLPRARVVSVGPKVWGQRDKHLESCELVIAAFYDTTVSEAWYQGDPATFPSLA